MFFVNLPGRGYVCAHRGTRSLAPENTMLAAELCLQSGADFWEMDVQRTADGSLVVFHDDYLNRTTDVATNAEYYARIPWAVSSFTFAELQTLDAGSWFLQSDAYGTLASGEVTKDIRSRIEGQKIPTLTEALEFTRTHAFPINIELKDQIHAKDDMSIVHDVLATIRNTGTTDLVLISSFNHAYLAEMHKLAPEVPLAVLVEDVHPESIVDYITYLGASGYHPDAEITDAELVTHLTEKGIRVSPYTVNEMDQAMALLEAGCYSIITDYPQRLRKRIDNK